jgi:hypothetical protein
MTDPHKSFREKLDTLIELFKRVREKSLDKDIPGIDNSFFQNFDFVLNNYEMIKYQLSDEMLEQFGAPIQTLIEQLIEQLKDELGEDFYSSEPMKELSEDLTDIDSLLKSKDLSNDQINELLDKRSDILSKGPEDKMVEE